MSAFLEALPVPTSLPPSPLKRSARRLGAPVPEGAHRVGVKALVLEAYGTGTLPKLGGSLIPALERAPRLAVERIYLPDRGALASYRRVAAGQQLHRPVLRVGRL